jgi:hypothetical protein
MPDLAKASGVRASAASSPLHHRCNGAWVGSQGDVLPARDHTSAPGSIAALPQRWAPSPRRRSPSCSWKIPGTAIGRQVPHVPAHQKRQPSVAHQSRPLRPAAQAPRREAARRLPIRLRLPVEPGGNRSRSSGARRTSWPDAESRASRGRTALGRVRANSSILASHLRAAVGALHLRAGHAPLVGSGLAAARTDALAPGASSATPGSHSLSPASLAAAPAAAASAAASLATAASPPASALAS